MASSVLPAITGIDLE